MPLSLLILIAFLAAAATIDVRTRRIPNRLCVVMAVTGLVVSATGFGLVPIGHATFGLLLGFALMLPLWLSGALGAGDVKLMAAAGAWLGVNGVLWAIGGAFAASCVMAIVYAAQRGQLRAVLQTTVAAFTRVPRIGPMLMVCGIDGTTAKVDAPPLPFAVPVAAGVVLALVLV